jgi:ABC-type multidrug transport system ATPase subunit
VSTLGTSKSVTPAHPEVAVRLADVVKEFGPKVAVGGVSFEIPRGQVFGLIGPNGAGKTTTFSMIAGYLAPTRGEARVLDAAPGDLDKLRGRVGVLPQDALLPDDRVGQFLRHCCRLQGMSAVTADTESRARLKEVKGDDWWDLRTGALSHGMSKRVALAQALLGNPELVLLDEPTAGLDPRVAYEVRSIVKARRGSCTLVISSHNLQELEEVCDAAAILDRGKLVGYGTIAELTSASGEFHVELLLRGDAGGGAFRSGAQMVPVDAINAIPSVKRAWLDESRGALGVEFGREVELEAVIAATLRILLDHQVPIRGLTRGRGLEQRVMELT